MATVNHHKSKDGTDSFRVRVFLGRDKEGKQIVKTRTYSEKDLKHTTLTAMQKEVEKLAEVWEAKLRNRPIKTKERADKALINSFVPEWQEWLVKRAEANIISEATVAYYKRDYKYYCKEYFENYTVEGVTPAVAKKFISDLRTGNGFNRAYSHKSTSHALTAINSLFTFLIDEKQLITDNPFVGMTIPREKSKGKSKKRKAKSLTQEEFLLLMKALDAEYNGRKVLTKYRALFITMLTTGFRVEEIVALKWNDLYVKNGYHMLKADSAVSETVDRKQVESEFLKTDESYRDVQLPEIAYKALMDWKEEQAERARVLFEYWKGKSPEEFDEQYIFSSEDGAKPMNKNMPARELHKIIRSWNSTDEGKKNPIKDITAYDLRHTNTSLLLLWGENPLHVAYNLGHVDLSMVNQVYGHKMENNVNAPSLFDVHSGAEQKQNSRREEVMKKLEALSTEELERLLNLKEKQE